MKKFFELKIAQLERQNKLLEKMMRVFPDLTEQEHDAILDEINQNKEMIKKLKEGLK
jgi:lauroyl/myristoyl acyltransferase